MNICHLTTVHQRHDVRIFEKECVSLATAGYDVTLVVADGRGDEVRRGVRIRDAGLRPAGRLMRFIFSRFEIRRAAFSVDADLYHFHDPELIPVGLWLRRRGKLVVYDSHEDLPRQLLQKTYGSRPLKRALSVCMEWYERRSAARLDAIVVPTDGLAARFRRFNGRVTVVRNYPLLEEFARPTEDSVLARRGACYVGGIFRNRGAFEIAEAAKIAGTVVTMAGPFQPSSLGNELREAFPESFVYAGTLDRTGVARLLSESAVGLVVLHDIPSYRESLPVKLFEYMAAGLPVIASNFPLWRGIVEGGECGRCVDPSDPRAIASAIDEIVGNPELARRMGANGRRLVEERYNWAVEERALLDLYRELETSP